MTTQGDGRIPQRADADQPAPTLSVTVLNYNYARYLPQCLDSILRQTWTDFELILINDCSTDNSLEVIQPYLADPRVRLVDHPQNKGYISSLIEGSELSRGKYITVISADDYCVSDRAFETLLQMMEADTDVAFAYSAFSGYAADGTRVWSFQPYAQSHTRLGVEAYRDLVLEAGVLHSGTIIRATSYEAVGGYDPSARYGCDTRMWLMLCSQGKVAFCADELYAFRKHGLNMSTSLGGIRGGLQEHLYSIKKSFDIMRRSPGITQDLYVRAVKRNLTFPAMQCAFGGRLLLAWYAFWCAVRIHPLFTLMQARTLVLIARTVLGSRHFQTVRSRLRPILRRDAGQVGAASSVSSAGTRA